MVPDKILNGQEKMRTLRKDKYSQKHKISFYYNCVCVCAYVCVVLNFFTKIMDCKKKNSNVEFMAHIEEKYKNKKDSR